MNSSVKVPRSDKVPPQKEPQTQQTPPPNEPEPPMPPSLPPSRPSTGGGGALMAAVSKNDVDAAKALLESGADVNERVKLSSMFDATKTIGDKTLGKKFEKGNTPLHLAVIRNNPDMVELLLEYGANKHAQNPAGNTPMRLSKGKDPKIAELLGATSKSSVMNSTAKGLKHKRKSRKTRKSRKSRKTRKSRKSRKYRRH